MKSPSIDIDVLTRRALVLETIYSFVSLVTTTTFGNSDVCYIPDATQRKSTQSSFTTTDRPRRLVYSTYLGVIKSVCVPHVGLVTVQSIV